MEPKDLQDLLGLLGLGKHAGDKDISRAYRKCALQMHPDKGGSAEAMKKLNGLMAKYRLAQEGVSEGPDLGCDESPLSSDTEEDEPAASSGYFSQSQRSGAPPDHHPSVSASEYIDAYKRLHAFKLEMDSYITRMQRRKQNLDPCFQRLVGKYSRIPWGTFGRLFKEA